MVEQVDKLALSADRKAKIRERYKGISEDELDVIPAIKSLRLEDDHQTKRVAVYARVSTDDPRQTSSYELQKNHYQDVVSRHVGWELIGIYADIYNQRLIQCPAHGGVEKCVKQRLSADLDGLPKALLFYVTIWWSGCKKRLNPIRSQNKNVYEK